MCTGNYYDNFKGREMNIAIIADDLTGACDTGVQLVNYGIDASVIIQNNKNTTSQATIYNTDSRALEKKQAYEQVSEVIKTIEINELDILYKKIDSTMRGNIGSELNAIYDQFQPDFVLINPAHPNNGRIVRDGIHYLNEVPLSETEVAKDPKTPVNESNIAKLVQQSSNKPVKHISYELLRKDKSSLLNVLADWKKQGIHYITIDTIVEEDLNRTLQLINSDYSFVLCGSAGLINYVPKKYGYEFALYQSNSLIHSSPALFVIGSISERGRLQLDHLLEKTDVVGVEISTMEILKGGRKKKQEINRIYSEMILAFNEKKSCAFYSSNNVEKTKDIGLELGISNIEISNIISNELGNIATEMINENNLTNLFLTGGDTAQQVFTKLGIGSYKLIGELELGVPIGEIDSQVPIHIMTKAGNFGTTNVMTKAYNYFQNKASLQV